MAITYYESTFLPLGVVGETGFFISFGPRRAASETAAAVNHYGQSTENPEGRSPSAIAIVTTTGPWLPWPHALWPKQSVRPLWPCSSSPAAQNGR